MITGIGGDTISTMCDLAFVLTHNRPKLLRECVTAIARQVQAVCVIDNASSPPIEYRAVCPTAHTLIYDSHQPPNLAVLMNVGFDWAQAYAWSQSFETWNVACLCDDVLVPPGWFDAVRSCVRATGAAAGSTHQVRQVSEPLLKTQPDSDIYNRMQGSACVFRGELGLRADEDMHWWWQDTDLDWQARTRGGMVIAPGPVATNRLPNDYTNARPELAQRAGLDGEVFQKKWGFRPW